MAPDVLLAFAGDGPIPWEAAAALLDDHLDGYPDDARIEALLPVTQVTEGVTEKTFNRFLREVEIPYDIYTDGTDTRAQREIVRGARDEYEVDDVAHAIISRLVAAAQADIPAELIVALVDGEEPQDLVSALIDEALAHDIPVRDICQGLMSIGGTPEAPPQEAEEEPEPPADVERSNTMGEAYKLTVPLLERSRRVYAALLTLGVNTEIYQAEINRIEDALDGMERLLASTTAEEEPAPEPAPEPEPEPEDKPKRLVRKPKAAAKEEDEPIGKPRRVVEQEMRKVVRLADGTYRRHGRGRRPAGAEVVEITVEEFERLDLEMSS